MSFRHYSWSCTVFPSLLFVPCQLSSSRLYSQDETRQDLRITEMVGIEKFVSKSRDLYIYRTQFRIFLSFAGIIRPSIALNLRLHALLCLHSFLNPWFNVVS